MDGIISGKIDTSLLSWKTERQIIVPHDFQVRYSFRTSNWMEIKHLWLKVEGKTDYSKYNSAYLPLYMVYYFDSSTECYIVPTDFSTVQIGVRLEQDGSANNYYQLNILLHSAEYMDKYVVSLKIGTLY